MEYGIEVLTEKVRTLLYQKDKLERSDDYNDIEWKDLIMKIFALDTAIEVLKKNPNYGNHKNRSKKK